MRTPLLILALAAAVSGCATVRDPVVTAGATLGPDTRELSPSLPMGGGFVGVRTRLVGLETGVEAGRRMNQHYHIDAGPNRERQTAVQAYANATYTIDGGRRYRLYVLGGARYYLDARAMTDAAEYGFDPNDLRSTDHAVSLIAGSGVGYGPVALEISTPVPLFHGGDDMNPGIALRARVSVPILRLGGQ